MHSKVINLRSRSIKYQPALNQADFKSIKTTTVADTNTNYEELEINSLEGESICSSDLNYGLNEQFLENIEKDIGINTLYSS